MSPAIFLKPNILSLQQCEIMFRDVLSKYPLIANNSSQHSDILFPQVPSYLALAVHSTFILISSFSTECHCSFKYY